MNVFNQENYGDSVDSEAIYCEKCGEESECDCSKQNISLEINNRNYEAQYAYACGYHD